MMLPDGGKKFKPMNELKNIPIKRDRPWLFFALAFLMSWLFWLPAALMSQGGTSFPIGILSFLGGFGPSIGGVLMVYLTAGEDGRRDFWQRVFSFKRIGGRWYAIILFIFPLLVALSLLVEAQSGEKFPFFPYLAALAAEPLLVLFLPVIVLQVLLMGPLSEELGWRGYALDALQSKWSALLSSLIVGICWSIWHGPLFFIRDPGNFYYEWGFGTGLFWLFMLRMTVLSVLITWVYNNNRHSILSAILFHFAYNFTFSLVYPVPESIHLYGTTLVLLTSIIIVGIWGPKTIAGRKGLALDRGEPPIHRIA
jgi:membrane protease YdiL (CAAX protease family)